MSLRETRKGDSGGNSTIRSAMVRTPHQALFGDKRKNNAMRGTRGRYGGEERCKQGFSGAM
jgi:hypothetical protein